MFMLEFIEKTIVFWPHRYIPTTGLFCGDKCVGCRIQELLLSWTQKLITAYD